MPKLVNFSPFPNLRYYSWDNRKQEFGIVIVKGTYCLAPSGSLLIAEEQAPLVFTDLCHGAVNVTSVRHPSDLVPNKPRTDVIVNSIARAPGGVPKTSWQCGIGVGGAKPLQKVLTVTGPREWRPRWKRELSETQKAEWREYREDFESWALSEPEPITELPIHFEYAYGGLLTRRDDEGKEVIDTNQHNPIGRGWLDPKWTDATKPQPAPQIELLGDPIRDPYKRNAPQSLGPIPPAWLPRRPLGGTYDKHWQENVWPGWAEDYSFAYHNSAHPDLIVDGYLRGDEPIQLAGCCADKPMVSFSLPGDTMIVDFARADGVVERMPMNLDTLYIDAADEDVREWRFMLSWRVNFEPDMFTEARTVLQSARRHGGQRLSGMEEEQSA